MGYPQDIRPLTGLRFVAAFWLLVYFFWGRFGVPLEQAPGVVERGYLGVDLFFVLSGFVLAHVYGPQVESRTFHYGSFLWARLARIYPLHLLCLAAMILVWAAGRAVGATFEPSAFDTGQIIHHVLLIQAWGTVASDGWNFPSWSISAELFAYLLFPLLFAAVALLRRAPVAALAASIALTFAGSFWFARSGVDFHNLTWQGGALRIVPSFLAGCALWQIGRTMAPMAPSLALGGVAGSVAWIAVTSELGLSSAVIWLGLVALVFFVAATATGGRPILASPRWVWLGEISFAVYMIHLPVDIIYYQVLERLIGTPTGLTAVAAGAGAFLAVLVAAAASYAWFERPVRQWMRANPPPLMRAPHGSAA
jgi:peptidoglycan/LPS O-acetylase OafA/YrhL